MARSIGRPMRYFLAKRAAGPALIIAERIDEIAQQLEREGLADQFHPSYTRMVPAHHILELQLVGCPDPNPTLTRFFAPPRNRLAPDIDVIGAEYFPKTRFQQGAADAETFARLFPKTETEYRDALAEVFGV